MLTEKQKQLIKQLADVITQINEECNRQYNEDNSQEFDDKVTELYITMAKAELNDEGWALPFIVEKEVKRIFNLDV
jgi:predicted transcriptional regulator